MTAAAADIDTPRRAQVDFEYDVAADTGPIYAGTMVFLDTSGNAEPAATATGKIGAGVCQEQVDNTDGAIADKRVKVKTGTFRFANGDTITKAHIGDPAYAFDDKTVKRVAGSMSQIGTIVQVDDDGVWVHISAPLAASATGLLATNNLSDLGTLATAINNLGLDDGSDALRFLSLAFGSVTEGIVKAAKVSLTGTQIKAAATTPITLVAAVADKILIPIVSAWKFTLGSEILVEPSAPDDFALRWVNGSGHIISEAPDSGVLFASAGPASAFAMALGVFQEGLLAAAVNVPIVVHNTGTNLTGNASNDAALEVFVLYFEVDIS